MGGRVKRGVVVVTCAMVVRKKIPLWGVARQRRVVIPHPHDSFTVELFPDYGLDTPCLTTLSRQ